jgi:general secretion pathway protein J
MLPNNKKLPRRHAGFTLLEILIALFIFSIVSMIMVSALHSVLTTQSVMEKNTARFNQLQIALVILSRDMEQAVNRPVVTAAGANELAMAGTKNDIRFTHAGHANPLGEMPRSTLQRVHYFTRDHVLIRETWQALDITHDTQSSERELLNDVEELRFEYLDRNGKFHRDWPDSGKTEIPLPRAVRVYITLKTLGKMSQLYVLPN